MATIIHSAKITKESVILPNMNQSPNGELLAAGTRNSSNVVNNTYITQENSLNTATTIKRDESHVDDFIFRDKSLNAEKDFVVEHERDFTVPDYDVEPEDGVETREKELERTETARLQEEQKRIDKAIQEGHEEGREEGYKSGLDKAQEDASLKLETLENLISAFSTAVDEKFTGINKLASEIVLESLFKVFGKEMTDLDNIIAVIRNVVETAHSREKLKVRVSHEDYKLLQLSKFKLLNDDGQDGARIVADEHVELGGCILETGAGTFDGRLEVQLARLREVIIEAKEDLIASMEAKPKKKS